MLKRFGRKSQQPSPPLPTKSLYELLNLNPWEERTKYDDRAVIEQVLRNPKDAKRIHQFSAYYNHELYPLYMAVLLGCSLEAVEALYEPCPHAIQHKDRYGETVLHGACGYKPSLEVATFLVEKYPAALEMKDNSGWTPLHCACSRGAPLEVVGMLFERHPAALNIKNEFGNTPLMAAEKNNASPFVLELFREAKRERSFFASRGSDLSKLLDLHPVKQRAEYDEEAVLQAIRRDPNAAKEKYIFAAYQYHFLYPLTMAIALGASLEVVKLIYDAHPSANYAMDNDGKTPLMLAKENNASVEVTRLLLDASGLFGLLNLHPVNERKQYDNEAVLKAIRRDPRFAKHQHTFPAYDKSRNFYPLTMAVALGASVEVVEELYNACTDAIKETDNIGRSVLHVACQYKSLPQVVEFLADKHPSALDIKDNLGQLPLHVACYWGAPAEVLEMLVARSPSSLVAKTKKGKTPYMLSKETNASSEVLQILTAKTVKRPSQGKEEKRIEDKDTTEKRRPSKIAIPKNICIATKLLRLGDRIGKGAFAEVFEGTYKRRGYQIEVVAFKQFNIEESELSDDDATSIERELDVLHSFQLHENVVTLLGACSDLEAIDANGRKAGFGMMMELADLGSLRKYLVNLNTDDEPRALQSILLDTARGMLALHSQRPRPIIHRDLKSMNILLFSAPSSEAGVVAKISDFGLARAVTNSSAATATKGGGTPNWMAPETFFGKKSSVSSDVWSFGMVIYEVATCRIPYHGVEQHQLYHKMNKKELPDLSKIRSSFPDSISSLMKKCCNFEAKERPRFGAIVERLSDLLGKEQTALHSLRGGSLEDRLESQRKLLELKAQLDKQAAEDARKYKEAWASLSSEECTEEALQALSSFAAQHVGSARQPEWISSVDDLMADAKACRQGMCDAMCEVVEAAGGTFIAGDLKGRDRVEHKTNRDYDGDCRRVVDVVRATGLFESLSQLKAIVKLLENCDSLAVIRCKDRLNRPLSSGYRDILVNVVQSTSNGPSHVAELQVHLKTIKEIKEVSHRVYELQRVAGWVPE